VNRGRAATVFRIGHGSDTPGVWQGLTEAERSGRIGIARHQSGMSLGSGERLARSHSNGWRVKSSRKTARYQDGFEARHAHRSQTMIGRDRVLTPSETGRRSD